MTPRPRFDPERRAPRLAPWGALLALVGAALGGWIGIPLVLVGLSLLLLACVSREDGFLLLGPLASAELTRAARLGRPQLWRAIYAVAAGAIVFLNLAAVIPGDKLLDPPRLNRKVLTDVNEAISYWFGACLFVYVSVLTVQVMAGAVAEEREKQRWDVLLTTDLRGREILLGKLFGRLPVVLDPLLASLPILAALPMFGGVPAWFAGAVLICCVSVMFGLGGVALFYSVFAPHRASAMAMTFITVVLYLAVSGVGVGFRGVSLDYLPVTVGDLADWFLLGNPAYLIDEYRHGTDQEAAALRAAWHFAVFQFAVFFLFGLTAIRRLPRAVPWGKPADTLTGTQRVKVAAAQATHRDRRPTDPAPVLKPEKEPVDRPPVPDWSIVWWERYGWLNKGQMKTVNGLMRSRVWVISAASAAVFLGAWVREWVAPHGGWQTWPGFLANFILGVAGLVSVAVILPVPFRAAKCVVRERAADTLDGLLLVPLSRREILFQKWLGVCLCDWPLFAVLLAAVAPGVLLLAIPLVPALLFAASTVLTVGVLAAIGVAISVAAKKPGDAVFRMVLVLGLFLVLGGSLTSVMKPTPNDNTMVAGVCPPAAFGLLMSELELDQRNKPFRHAKPGTIVLGWLCGVAVYGLLGYAAWRYAGRRFEAEKAN